MVRGIAGLAVMSLFVSPGCRSRAFLPPSGADAEEVARAGREGAAAQRAGAPGGGSRDSVFTPRKGSRATPGVDLERGRSALVVVTDAKGDARIETGVFVGVDARGVRLLAAPGARTIARAGAGTLGSVVAAGGGRAKSVRASPAPESPPAAKFVSQSGNVTTGRVIADDGETVTVVDADCAVIALVKSRLDPALTVLHGRRIPTSVFPRSLEGALQAAWYDALAREADARARVVPFDAIGVLAGAGQSVALRLQPGGPRVEGRFIDVGDECLLLDLPSVGRRALPIAAIDAASVSVLPDAPQEEGAALPVASGWPGTAAFARARGYLRRGPFVAFDKPRVAQGFRLHVSAVPFSAEAVASVVLPLLVARGAPHLAFPRAEEYEATRAGAQRGKFITVFPRSDAEAASLARAIDSALAPLSLPYTPVAGERVVGRTGQVTARFAPFTYAAGGTLVRPDGARENDVRLDDWKPRWARDPF